ncbi:DUF7168 domain-containing protein [Brenneria alni]|uniref:DUF7168 domain-containing protein n=1 Tax=Brenneria alni TaxID=71656 RepID=UPI001F0C9626|nr:hypothetical protein [Brenneria alni]
MNKEEKEKYMEKIQKLLHLAKRSSSTKTNRADQFCAGWVSGAWNAISRFAVEPEEQQLMLLYYKQISEEFSKLESREAKSCRGDDDAYHAGYHSGKDARLHQAVNGTSMGRIGR